MRSSRANGRSNSLPGACCRVRRRPARRPRLELQFAACRRRSRSAARVPDGGAVGTSGAEARSTEQEWLTPGSSESLRLYFAQDRSNRNSAHAGGDGDRVLRARGDAGHQDRGVQKRRPRSGGARRFRGAHGRQGPHCRGLFKNKLQATAGHALPDPLVAELHRKQTEPGSADKEE